MATERGGWQPGRFLFARYLNGFDPDGRKRCSCGQVHELGTREILLGDGVWAAIPERLRREHGEDTVIWVLSDENTEAAAGAALKRALRRTAAGRGGAARFAEAGVHTRNWRNAWPPGRGRPPRV